MTAATYKWLMGPYSLGLLYVSKRWQEEGVPIEHNWIHRKGSENFARLVDYQDAYASGAVRYDVGERSNFALVPAAEKALRRILEWGVANVAETLAGMTGTIAERASELGLEAPPPVSRAGHYLGLKMKGDPPEGLLVKLAERKVYVSVRGTSIRVTPHLYNDERDIDRFIAALREAI
jgi:selenocysteine lyase/cysteine desulfurase